MLIASSLGIMLEFTDKISSSPRVEFIVEMLAEEFAIGTARHSGRRRVQSEV